MRKLPFTRLLAAGLLAATLTSGIALSAAQAENIETLLPYVVDNHDRVRADEARLRAARNRAREALGDWYPTLSNTLNAGTERQQNDNGDDTSTGFNEWDIELTQLLWDFGSTNAAVDKARLQVEEARLTLVETRQSLILEAITAYMNLIRSHQSLKFAIQSEDNIRKQTGLEEALVGLGSGFSTDVLQAKSQLAGAEARRASSEGALASSYNRYKAVFGRIPDDVDALENVPFPAPFLPTSLTQATDIALEMNPGMKNAILAADIARQDLRKTRADNFAPKIEASGSRKFKKNVGGTIGSEQETLAKVEMTFDFNLGFTAINTLKASEQDLSASTYSAADTRRTIEEQVRNAWQQLDTAKRTATHLDNQANIEAAFLELARNERQLGRRSLIDVLSGETTLINAKSDALSARTDVIIAAYGVLAAAGLLEYDLIKQSKGIEPPVHSPAPPGKEQQETPAAAPVPAVTPSPAPPGQTRLYEPDTAVAVARSSRDLRELIRTPAVAERKTPSVAPASVLLASISTPGAVPAQTAALGFDTQGIEGKVETFATNLAVATEFAAAGPIVVPAPDVAVLPDIADTSVETTNSLLAMLDTSGTNESLEPIDSAPTEVAMAPIDRVPADSIHFDDGSSHVSSVPVEVAAAAHASVKPASEPEIVAAPRELAETPSADEETGGVFSGVFGVIRYLDAAHDAYEADTAAPVELAAVPEAKPEPKQEPRAVLPEPAATPDVPDNIGDAVETTFGRLFDFLDQAARAKTADTQAVETASVVTDAPEIMADPAVPETFAEAVTATVQEALPATDTADAPVETASVPQTNDPAMAASADVPEALGSSIGSTFGSLFDFLEEAHRRKVADETKSKPTARPQPKAVLKAPAAAPRKTADAVPATTPLRTVTSSLGSLFGDLAEIDLTYRPLRADELPHKD